MDISASTVKELEDISVPVVMVPEGHGITKIDSSPV
jgi:hypothetical protein